MDIVSLILGVILVTILSVVVAAAYHLRAIDKKYAHIPGPPNDGFWFGCTASLGSINSSEMTLQNFFQQLFIKYGKTFKMRVFNAVMVSTVDPDMVKEFGLSGRHPKSRSLRHSLGSLFGLRFLGDKSMATESNIEKAGWKRVQFNAMFSRSFFKDMAMEFNTAVEPLMKRLTGLADGKSTITMLDEFNHVTLDVLAKIAFGMDINSVDSLSNPFTSAVFNTFQGLAKQIFNPFFMFNPKNWEFVKSVQKDVRILRNLGKKSIEERIAAKARGDYVPEDILSLMVEMKEKNPDIDIEELVDDFVAFFVAGQETTAGLLSFMMITLGQNPKAMKKLQEEIDDVVGEKPVIEYNDLQKLTFLDMVIKETLRLFPPGGSVTKDAAFDVTINGLLIPKGSVVLLNSRNASRMEEYFDDPLVFDPERFSAKADKRVNPFTYYPFSIGPRTCLGKYFVDIEVKIILIKMIQRFEFVLDPNQSFDEQDFITTRPKGRAAVNLTLRGITS